MKHRRVLRVLRNEHELSVLRLEVNRNAVTREVKRLELEIAHLARRLPGQAE